MDETVALIIVGVTMILVTLLGGLMLLEWIIARIPTSWQARLSPPLAPSYVQFETVPPHQDAVPAGTGTGTEVEPQMEPLEEELSLDRSVRDPAVAEALGQLLAAGMLTEDRRTSAMELLFGPRGRRWQRVRPIIEAAHEQGRPLATTPIAGRPVPSGITFQDDLDPELR